MQIYIGNLSEMTTVRHLSDLFLPFGSVRFPKIASDERTGRSLRFGSIEMEANCARMAIKILNRCLFMNSYVEVKEKR